MLLYEEKNTSPGVNSFWSFCSFWGTTKWMPPWGCSKENSIPTLNAVPSATKCEASCGIVTTNSPALLSGSVFRAANKCWKVNTPKFLLKYINF